MDTATLLNFDDRDIVSALETEKSVCRHANSMATKLIVAVERNFNEVIYQAMSALKIVATPGRSGISDIKAQTTHVRLLLVACRCLLRHQIHLMKWLSCPPDILPSEAREAFQLSHSRVGFDFKELKVKRGAQSGSQLVSSNSKLQVTFMYNLLALSERL